MKNSFYVLIVSALMLICSAAGAQNATNFQKQWQDRLQSEKIAFLTNEMSLTPQEAQVFWPIYNQAQKEQAAATEESFKAFAALDNAIRAGKSEKEISDLLNKYTLCLEQRDSSAKYLKEYLKVLSSEKVAKLYIGEEKFRQSKIYGLRQPQMMGGQPQARPWAKPQQEKNK
ncbi:MAG: hypothetical protein Q4G10_04060 [Bacteroidia bacterium]|nr:hypothetical protein [Bacteroidia bacterium]